MLHRLAVVVTGCMVLVGFPAEARFGKGGSRGSSSSSGAHSHSSTPAGSSSSSSSGGSYSSGYGYRPGWSLGLGFVPAYRYGYYGYGRGYGYGSVQPEVVETEPPAPPSTPLRVSAGVEAQGYLTGFTLGATASVEGDRWGFVASGQNIRARADDGRNGYDNLQVITAHLTFAFLTGQYGRLRLEGGADAVFAPNLFALGPTAGLSGVIWVGGPFAIESSAMVTPYPFIQLDGKLGAAIGVGPVGFRAGVRAQLLNDRGVVDGVVHQDLFLGPYVGVAVVL